MQEKVENKTINLAVSTIRLTACITLRLALWGIRKAKENEARVEAKRSLPPRGKQTIRGLVGRNQGVIDIDIAETDLKSFEKHAREFDVDYAITRDKSVNPPKYLVFFRVRDVNVMTAASNAYFAKAFARNKRPSVLKTLHKLMDAIKDIPAKVISRDRQREQSR